MPISQDTRSQAIKTALGLDVLAVWFIAVPEQIIAVFQIKIERNLMAALIANSLLPETGREFVERFTTQATLRL